ncbi:MAG TPA: 6-phosphogluconolactonase [Rhodanobacteraceae bacterium]|nr:6-phosphogluconolactonase [Rhodanobacteraceae bacterium]
MSDTSIRASAGGTRWHLFASTVTLVADARDRIVSAANDAIALRGGFIIVLAGGNTPRALYRKLRDADTDWTRWHVYYGDERCVAADDPERNSVMATETLLDAVTIPREQCHAIPGELGPEAAARAYATTLQDVGTFDLVLLGLGEDGHTASLFADANEHRVDSRGDVIAVSNAPKPPPGRVSLSAARLSDAHAVLFLVDGESKHDAVRRWREGDAIPTAAIRPEAGVDVLVEALLMT